MGNISSFDQTNYRMNNIFSSYVPPYPARRLFCDSDMSHRRSAPELSALCRAECDRLCQMSADRFRRNYHFDVDNMVPVQSIEKDTSTVSGWQWEELCSESAYIPDYYARKVYHNRNSSPDTSDVACIPKTPCKTWTRASNAKMSDGLIRHASQNKGNTNSSEVAIASKTIVNTLYSVWSPTILRSPHVKQIDAREKRGKSLDSSDYSNSKNDCNHNRTSAGVMLNNLSTSTASGSNKTVRWTSGEEHLIQFRRRQKCHSDELDWRQIRIDQIFPSMKDTNSKKSIPIKPSCGKQEIFNIIDCLP